MELRKITCPACRARLFDADLDSIPEVKILSAVSGDWKVAYVMKCSRCKNKVAVKKTA